MAASGPILNKPNFKLITRIEMDRALGKFEPSYDPQSINPAYSNTVVQECLFEVLGDRVEYPVVDTELQATYAAHLLDLEGFVSERKIKLEKDSFGDETVNVAHLMSLAGWEQSTFLLLHLHFLIEFTFRLKHKLQPLLPRDFDDEILYLRLRNEIWITANAYRFKLACSLSFPPPKEDKGITEEINDASLIAGIKEFLKSLEKNWEDLGSGGELVLPVGTQDHAFYLTLVRFVSLNGAIDTLLVRIDNVGAGSEFLREAGKVPPYIRTSATKQDIAKREDVLSYLVELCKICYKSINDENVKDVIYKQQSYNRCQLQQPILKIAYPPLASSSTGHCVVDNFKVGLQYRFWLTKMPLNSALYQWVVYAEIRDAFQNQDILVESDFAAIVERREANLRSLIPIKPLPPSDEDIQTRLQSSLKDNYQSYSSLERIFDETKVLVSGAKVYLVQIDDSTDNESKEEQKDESEYSSAHNNDRYISLIQLFEKNIKGERPKTILITGKAGVGKSVACQKIATQWAEEIKEAPGAAQDETIAITRYLQSRFKAVFWLKLRECIQEINLYQSLTDRCMRGVNIPSPKELEEYLKRHNDDVLFILDGYDEVSDQLSLLEPFFNEITNYKNILLTSRPAIIDHLGRRKINFDQHVQNIGFTDTHIEDYVKQFMQQKQCEAKIEPLIIFLRARPSLWGIAHIPINLELICWLWSKDELQFEPEQKVSLSELYKIIVEKVIKTFLNKNSIQPLRNRENKIVIPTLNLEVITHFLERLAYHATKLDSILITSKTKLISDTLSICLKTASLPVNQESMEYLLQAATHKLGFLRTTTKGGNDPLSQTYCFIHRSFQEFFAGQHVANVLSSTPQTQEEKDEHASILADIRQKKYVPQYRLVWMFAAGLLYQEKKWKELEAFWNEVQSGSKDAIGAYELSFRMHFIDECEGDENVPLIRNLLQELIAIHYHIAQQPDSKDKVFYFTNWSRYILLQNCNLIVESLLREVRDQNPYVRATASRAIGTLSQLSKKQIITLFELAELETHQLSDSLFERSTNPNRGGNIFFLHEPGGTIGGARIAVWLQINSNPIVKEWLKEYISQHHASKLRPILQMAQRMRPVIASPRGYAVESHARRKEIPEKELITTLQDLSSSDEDRTLAASCLGRLSLLIDVKGIESALLKTVLADPSPQVRRAAIHAVGKLPKSNFPMILEVTLLNVAISDNDAGAKYDALLEIERLSDFTQPKKVEVDLLKIINDEKESARVRAKAIDIFNRLKQPEVRSIRGALLTALRTGDAMVKIKAATALANLGIDDEEVIFALLTLDNTSQESARNQNIDTKEPLKTLVNSSAASVDALLKTIRIPAYGPHVVKLSSSVLSQLTQPNRVEQAFVSLCNDSMGDEYLKMFFSEHNLLCIDPQKGEVTLGRQENSFYHTFTLNTEICESLLRRVSKLAREINSYMILEAPQPPSQNRSMGRIADALFNDQACIQTIQSTGLFKPAPSVPQRGESEEAISTLVTSYLH